MEHIAQLLERSDILTTASQ